MSYSNVDNRSVVTLNSTTPELLFDSNTSTRVGWRCVIPSALGAGIGVLFYIQTAGSAAPTKADIVASPNLRAEADDYVKDGASGTLDIYVVLESVADIDPGPQEILQ